MGIALVAYLNSTALDGNGFIATLIGGIVFSAVTRRDLTEVVAFTENASAFLAMLVWGIFGGFILPIALRVTVDWRPIAYAILSLTVVRMVPVALALTGTGLRRDTKALMGWFGPRGLASVVFTLLAFITFEEAGRSAEWLGAVASWTILLSVIAHGLSAVPLSGWYARRLERASGPLAELVELPELPGRRSLLI